MSLPLLDSLCVQATWACSLDLGLGPLDLLPDLLGTMPNTSCWLMHADCTCVVVGLHLLRPNASASIDSQSAFRIGLHP